jgi:bacteriocin-like protein
MSRATAVRELSEDELKAVSGGTFGEPMGKTDVIKVMGNYPRPNDTAMDVWFNLLRQYGF